MILNNKIKNTYLKLLEYVILFCNNKGLKIGKKSMIL